MSTCPLYFICGSRYYNPATALWLGVDPLASKYPGVSPYVYCVSNPVKYVDPDGRDAFLIVFPDYKISAFGRKFKNLGHAGILLIDNKTGLTKYYEYGRYDSNNKGIVRTYRIPDVKINDDGNIDADRDDYSIFNNNCGTFAIDVIKQDKSIENTLPIIIDTRPNSIIEEYKEKFLPKIYNPNE